MSRTDHVESGGKVPGLTDPGHARSLQAATRSARPSAGLPAASPRRLPAGSAVDTLNSEPAPTIAHPTPVRRDGTETTINITVTGV